MTPAPAPAPPRLGRAAFFDVDETLVAAKTMVEFWRFWRTRGRPEAAPAADRVLAGLLTLPREEANRGYFRLYRGVHTAELAAAGRDWYAGYRLGPRAMVRATLAALRQHRDRGDRIVLVSGSLRACLEPLAAELSAHLVCTEQEVAPDGRFTGELLRPMIGDCKRQAVTAALTGWDLDPRDCFAYGDHGSDLGMLRAVGNPVAVGEDPVLRRAAGRHGWRVLPAAAGALHPPAPGIG